MENKETQQKDLESATTSLLEKKKNELTLSRGTVLASKEAIKVHKEFIEKARGELKELVSQGKINQDIANFVLLWITKTAEPLEEFSATMKSSYDIKTGEILMLSNVINMLKTQEEEKDVLPDPVPTPTPTFATNLQTSEDANVSPPKKKRGRPDQVGKLGETVKRIKESKLKKNQ
jgi:hypothetical protein